VPWPVAVTYFGDGPERVRIGRIAPLAPRPTNLRRAESADPRDHSFIIPRRTIWTGTLWNFGPGGPRALKVPPETGGAR